MKLIFPKVGGKYLRRYQARRNLRVIKKAQKNLSAACAILDLVNPRTEHQETLDRIAGQGQEYEGG